MAELELSDLKQIVLHDTSFGPREIAQIQRETAHDRDRFQALRRAVGELQSQEDRSPAANVRLGVCLYLIGRYFAAIEALETGDGGALAHFYLARACFARRYYERALTEYEAAAAAGYDADACALGRAGTLRAMGRPQEALKVLDNLFGAVEQTAEYLAQRAVTVAAVGGNPDEVVALYERAVKADDDHPAALFGLALENDRRGNDATALQLYRRAAERFPTHVGSLLNLGILHEDRDQYDAAAQCYRRILDIFPDHPRASLFLKDTEASTDQYYDEEAHRRRDRLGQVLSTPVTDFELSVRSRNCLEKMGIHTLGDLCRCTEAELLASKNFGETSLVEIKEMVAGKGLYLGQFADERAEAEVLESDELEDQDQVLLNQSVEDIGLSVRAKKCMVRLGVSTVGDLVRRTGDDLLECKNFGVTSLNEVREKLAGYGLKLRGE